MTVPSILAGVCVLIVLAGYREQRFAITDRRVLALGASGVSTALARDATLVVERFKGELVVRRGERAIAFEGIDDVEAAIFALGQSKV